MKYKWKDKVRIKSKKELECISEVTNDMLKNGGTVMTIACLVEDADAYLMKEDGDFHFLWTDEMIEGLVEEEDDDCEKCGLIRNSIRCLFMDNCPHNKQKNIIEIPEDCVLKDENGNIINATKIILEKKKNNVSLTQEQINTMVHDSCALFCKHCGCGIPRETCMSLGTCKDHDEYRAAIRAHLMEKHKD